MWLPEYPACLLTFPPFAGAAMSMLTSSPGLALRARFLFSTSSCLLSMALNFVARGCLVEWVETDGRCRAFAFGAFAEGLGAGGHRRICDSGSLVAFPPPRPAQVSFRVHKHRKKQERLGKIFANFIVGNNTGSSNLFSSQQINKASPCSPSS